MRRTSLTLAVIAVLALTMWLVLNPAARQRIGLQRDVVTVTQSAAPTQLPKLAEVASSLTLREAVRQAVPAVVNIYTSKRIPARLPYADDPLFRRYFGDDVDSLAERATSLGSGVVVSRDGFILTNNHVIDGADEVAVSLRGGQAARVKVVGTDPETDLAVLKIDMRDLTPITFGNSAAVEVGDVVLAIGNPFGVGETVTMGIVSATGRNRVGINTFENFIQTDAAINPGNSGGALVDASGNLIGINTAILSPTGGSLGIGFAIPVSLAKEVMEQLIARGTVERGWIGVQAEDIAADQASSAVKASRKGVVIAGVLRGGPAQQAGVKPGDVLMAINGKQIADVSEMIAQTAALKPGQRGEFLFVRDGEQIRLTVTVGRRPPVTR